MNDMLVMMIFVIIRVIISAALFVGWIAGIVIANGFWSTLFAFFIPFWGYYLVVERLITGG